MRFAFGINSGAKAQTVKDFKGIYYFLVPSKLCGGNSNILAQVRGAENILAVINKSNAADWMKFFR